MVRGDKCPDDQKGMTAWEIKKKVVEKCLCSQGGSINVRIDERGLTNAY